MTTVSSGTGLEINFINSKMEELNRTELTHDEGVDHEVDGGVEGIVPQGGETHVGHHCADMEM